MSLPDPALERFMESRRDAIAVRARNAMDLLGELLADPKLATHGRVYSQVERMREAYDQLRAVLP